MTIILNIQNRDQSIQLSDRKLSSRGVGLESSYNKAILLVCDDGRFSIGFTGLAVVGHGKIFSFERSLFEFLEKYNGPQFGVVDIVNYLADCFSNLFNENETIKKITGPEKCLTISIAGYCYNQGVTKLGIVTISNYHNLDVGTHATEPWGRFQVFARIDSTIPPEEGSLVLRLGDWKKLDDKSFSDLVEMTRKKSTASHLVNFAKGIIIEAVNNRKADQTIGLDLSEIRIPSDLTKPVQTFYYPYNMTHEQVTPSTIFLKSNGKSFFKNIKVEPMEKNASTGWVRKQGRNKPCKCGSGLKFKKCHGK